MAKFISDGAMNKQIIDDMTKSALFQTALTDFATMITSGAEMAVHWDRDVDQKSIVSSPRLYRLLDRRKPGSKPEVAAPHYRVYVCSPRASDRSALLHWEYFPNGTWHPTFRTYRALVRWQNKSKKSGWGFHAASNKTDIELIHLEYNVERNCYHSRCMAPPPGWVCTRVNGHPGPCSALPVPDHP